MSDPPAHFPYAHSGEPDLPGYLRVRAEGRSLRENLWSTVGYLRKYRHPKFTAPPEEVRYFDHQRQLLRYLAGEAPAGPPALRLAAVGDLMWLRNNWLAFLSPEVLTHLNAHDVVLGNLESVIARSFPVPTLLPDYFTYNSDPALVTSFRRPNGASTFTALATANNHCLDRGDIGLRETLELLDGLGVLHAGVRSRKEDRPYALWESKGIKFGFYAACWGLNEPGKLASAATHVEVLPGLVPQVRHPVDLSGVRAALDGMSADGVEFKVVYLHWGYEFEFYPCPDLMRVGHQVVQAGADLVLGSHPHVVQPLEVCFFNGYERRYGGADLPALRPGAGCLLDDGRAAPRKALIAYSLGNFATAMYRVYCEIGAALSLGLWRDPATGAVDWGLPEARLVVNVRRHPATRTRRLEMLESYLQERERAGDTSARLREAAAFTRAHLGVAR